MNTSGYGTYPSNVSQAHDPDDEHYHSAELSFFSFRKMIGIILSTGV